MGAGLSLSVNRVSGSENISANTSQVDVLMQVTVTGDTYNVAMDDYGSITIDGTEISIGAVSVPQYSTVTLYSARHTVTHNADGTKTVQVSGAYNINTSSYQWLYASASVMCNTIPRATTPTIGAVTLGSPVDIVINAASSAFRHIVTYTFGGITDTIANMAAGGTYTWSPPLPLASQIPNAATGTGTITCTTYNGDTVIGTKTIGFTASVPASVVPTVSAVVSPVNANTWVSGKGIYAAGFSRARIDTTGAGVYGSTVSRIDITGDVLSYNAAASATSDVLTVGTKAITVTVTDSRRRTATTTKTITVQPYAPPAIYNLSYKRGSYSGGVWTANDTGADIKVAFTLGLSLTSYSNAGAITASCTGEDNQTTANAAAGAKTYYFTTIGVDNTRTVTISVTDSVGVTASKSMTVATVEVPLNIDAPNNRIAIGGIAEKDKTLQVKWPAELTKGLTVTGAITANGLISSTANGNTVTIGSQNADLCHFRNSANKPFYFNKGVLINGDIYPYSTEVQSCGTSAYPWTNTYTKALTLNGSAVTDFVVETGTNNDWFYRKWKSGKQEAWRQFNYGAVAITNAWGSLYESSALCCGLPTGMFTNVMYQQASLAGIGGAYVLCLSCGSWNTGYTQDMFAIRATPATTTALYVFHYLFGY